MAGTTGMACWKQIAVIEAGTMCVGFAVAYHVAEVELRAG